MNGCIGMENVLEYLKHTFRGERCQNNNAIAHFFSRDGHKGYTFLKVSLKLYV